jgi:hypothetical protein
MKIYAELSKKQQVWGILVIELLVILISGLMATDKVDWAYGILCCTPVGGILSLFYHPNDFFIGFSTSAWFLSGIQFLMVNYVIQQVGKVTKSKTELFLHSLAFTFFSGIIVAQMVNIIVLPIRNSLMDWLFVASLLKKIFPLILLAIYYGLALGCLYLTLKIFWDNVKMLGVVTLFGGGLLLAWRIAIALLAGGRNGSLYAPLIQNFLTAIPENHPFMAQLGFTIIISMVYNWGLILLHNAKVNYEASLEGLDEFGKIDDMKNAVRYSRMSNLKKRTMLRKQPELVRKNLDMLEEYDIATMEKCIDAYEYREEIAYQGNVEEKDAYTSLLELLQQDYHKFCFRRPQRKLMRMSVKRFCKKWVPDRDTLDNYGQELLKTEFAYTRRSYPNVKRRYINVVMPIAYKCLFLLWIVSIYLLCSEETIIWAYYSLYVIYFPSVGFLIAFLVISLVYLIFRKDNTLSVFDIKAFAPIAAISLIFAILFSYRLTRVSSLINGVAAVLICAMGPIFVICILLNVVPVKNFIRKRKYFAWKEIRYIYLFADKQFDTVNTFHHRYRKHQVSVMICSQLRREEILDYLESSKEKKTIWI